MVNLVTVDKVRYLVDVGFGANGPCRPLPLIPGHEVLGVAPQSLRLQYKALPQHSDPSQRAWVYGHRDTDGAPWLDAYAFTEVEFFPVDFSVINLAPMTSRRSLFTQSVICVKFLINHGTSEIDGVVVLFNDEIKTKVRGQSRTLQKFVSEDERVQALKKYFDIELTEEERRGIIGLQSELKGRKGS